LIHYYYKFSLEQPSRFHQLWFTDGEGEVQAIQES